MFIKVQANSYPYIVERSAKQVMELIASFQVNHLKLFPGIYVSRRDSNGNCIVTTFDLRFIAPNREPVMEVPAIHTIEHLGATFLRNSKRKDEIIYFGPMGCRTGFYLVVFGEQTSEQIYPLIIDMCEFICGFEGDIPGARPEKCGNYSEHDLNRAKYYVKRYYQELTANKRMIYPD